MGECDADPGDSDHPDPNKVEKEREEGIRRRHCVNGQHSSLRQHRQAWVCGWAWWRSGWTLAASQTNINYLQIKPALSALQGNFLMVFSPSESSSLGLGPSLSGRALA
jgi:hypothetical protein